MNKDIVVRDCPKCGGALEISPDFKIGSCKYCDSTITFPASRSEYSLTKKEIIVTQDGVETTYESVDDMPKDLRNRYILLGRVTSHGRGRGVTIDGKKYKSIDELPDEYKALITPKGKTPPAFRTDTHNTKIYSSEAALEPAEHDSPAELRHKEMVRKIRSEPPQMGKGKLNYCPQCKDYVKTKMFNEYKCKKCGSMIYKIWRTEEGIRTHYKKFNE